MTAAVRRRAFWLATAAIATAALIAALARPERSTPDRLPGSAPARVPVELRPAPPKRPRVHTHPPARPGALAVRARASAAAARFVAAYLRYEARPTGSRARVVARLTVAGSPARAMLKTPPRPDPQAERGRLVLLEVHGPYRGWVKASAIVHYGPRRLLLELVLERGRDGRYRVRELSP